MIAQNERQEVLKGSKTAEDECLRTVVAAQIKRSKSNTLNGRVGILIHLPNLNNDLLSKAKAL